MFEGNIEGGIASTVEGKAENEINIKYRVDGSTSGTDHGAMEGSTINTK